MAKQPTNKKTFIQVKVPAAEDPTLNRLDCDGESSKSKLTCDHLNVPLDPHKQATSARDAPASTDYNSMSSDSDKVYNTISDNTASIYKTVRYKCLADLESVYKTLNCQPEEFMFYRQKSKDEQTSLHPERNLTGRQHRTRRLLRVLCCFGWIFCCPLWTVGLLLRENPVICSEDEPDPRWPCLDQRD